MTGLEETQARRIAELTERVRALVADLDAKPVRCAWCAAQTSELGDPRLVELMRAHQLTCPASPMRELEASLVDVKAKVAAHAKAVAAWGVPEITKAARELAAFAKACAQPAVERYALLAEMAALPMPDDEDEADHGEEASPATDADGG